MRRWLPASVVAVATLVAFLPSLWNGFVNYDDPINLLENPHYRGLGWANVTWMFTAHDGLYMPLTWLSYAIDYAIWDMRATGYHLTSLLLHALNAVLAYALIRRLRPDAGTVAAAAGALLFSLHPLRVESVAWATERRDVLSGAFLLLATLAYLRGGPRWLVASVALYACSLLSKGMALLFPVALVVLDVWVLRRELTWRTVAAKLPFALLAAGAIVVAFVAQERVAAIHDAPWGHRVMQPAYRVAFYVWKTVVPVGLSPLYLFRAHESPFEVRFILGFLAVAAVTAALFVRRTRWPGAWAAWAIALLILAPSLGVIQVGPHGPADRYTYLPALALSVVASAAVDRPMSRTVAAVVLAVLGLLTAIQCGVWRDSEALWTRAISVDGDHHIAYFNRGTERLERGAAADALADFDNAIRSAPPRPPPRLYVNRASARLALGDPAGALADCNAALRLDPRLAEAHATAGVALETAGEPARARQAYQRARDLCAPKSPLRSKMQAEIDRLSR